MSTLKLAILHGTNRPNNQSQRVANYVKKIAEENEDWDVEFVSAMEFEFPLDGNDDVSKNPEYSRITEEADAFLIVTPEYNHSYPGSLKRILDTELKNYIHKPVGIIGVSSGRFGGARAIEHLQPVVRELGLVPSFADVTVGNVKSTFDDDGQPTEDYVKDSVEASLTELKWLAQTLRWGRETLESKYH